MRWIELLHILSNMDSMTSHQIVGIRGVTLSHASQDLADLWRMGLAARKKITELGYEPEPYIEEWEDQDYWDHGYTNNGNKRRGPKPFGYRISEKGQKAIRYYYSYRCIIDPANIATQSERESIGLFLENVPPLLPYSFHVTPTTHDIPNNKHWGFFPHILSNQLQPILEMIQRRVRYPINTEISQKTEGKQVLRGYDGAPFWQIEFIYPGIDRSFEELITQFGEHQKYYKENWIPIDKINLFDEFCQTKNVPEEIRYNLLRELIRRHKIWFSSTLCGWL